MQIVNKYAILLFAAAFVCMTGGSKAAKLTLPDFEIGVSYWGAEFMAAARITEDDGSGDRINFKDNLGIEDENFFNLRLTWFSGDNSRLRFHYVNIGLNGEAQSDDKIDFGGTTYPVGSQILTNLDIQYYRASWIWQFFHSDNNRVRFGTILEAKGFIMKATLQAPELVTPLNKSETLKVLLPAGGLALDFDPTDRFNIFIEVSGLPAGPFGFMLDAEIGIKLHLIEQFSIAAGFRLFQIDAINGSDYAQLSISGPYLGAIGRF